MLPLFTACAFIVAAALTAIYAANTLAIFAALILVGLGLRRAMAARHWYQRRDPLLEILDYCVIDARSFKDWVYWQDVQEIAVSDNGTIYLMVENEERYARPNKCLCSVIGRVTGLAGPSKLMLYSIGVNCSAGELLAAIRVASRPYAIPIRRLPS
jgi:hypothetical protein